MCEKSSPSLLTINESRISPFLTNSRNSEHDTLLLRRRLAAFSFLLAFRIFQKQTSP